MASFDMYHDNQTKLEKSLADVQSAYQAFFSGKGYTLIGNRYDIQGKVKGLEVSYSMEHSWHPHQHTLLFLGKGFDGDLSQMEVDMLQRWQGIVGKTGGYSNEYGLSINSMPADKTGYIVKSVWHSGEDSHLSQWDLLLRYEQGEKWAGEKFVEYAQAFTGSQKLRWSPGLRGKLGIDTDKGKKRSRPGDECIRLLSSEDWQEAIG